MPFQVNIQRKEESRQQSGNSPFESFLTAAFGTFLAVLLAWRFLLSSDSQDDLREQQQQQSTNIGENKHRRIDDASSTTRRSSTKPTATTTSTGAQPCRSFVGIKNEFDNRHASNITPKSSSPPSSSSISNKGESSSQRPLTVLRLNSATPQSRQQHLQSANFMDIDNNSQGAKLSDDSGTETDFVDLSSVPPCLQHYSLFQMNDNDEVSVVTGDDDIKSDSSSERCELGILPAYLDTITEEDTDDLNTNSSGRSSPTRITRILNVREEFRRARELQLSIETKTDDDDESSPSTSSCNDVTAPSTPRNSNLNLNYFNPNNDQEHNRSRSTQQQQQASPKTLSTGETGLTSSAATINELQQHRDEEELILIQRGDNEKKTIVVISNDEESFNSSADPSLIIPIGVKETENKSDATVAGASDEQSKEEKNHIATLVHSDDEFLILERQIENRPLNLNYSIVESISTLFQEHYGVFNNSNSYAKNYRPSSSPTTMEYDLRKASRRFERYGHIYKDAPKSGMEEFDQKSNGFQSQIRLNSSSASLNNSNVDELNNSGILNRTISDDNSNKNDADVTGKGKLSTQMASENLNSTGDKNISVTTSILTDKTTSKETGRASSQSGPTFQPRPTTSPTTTTTTTTVETTKATIHSTSLLSPTCSVCGAKVFQSSGFKCRQCEKKIENNNSLLPEKNPSNSNNVISPSPINGATTTTNIPVAQLDDWSFSDDEMSSTSTNGEPSRGLVIATATSKAIINDPAGQKRTSLIAAASANAVSKNPYVALARATASAASKVSEVVQHAVDPDQQSKVSLVVSSTVCATGKDLKRASRENMFETEISSSEPTPELVKKYPRYHHYQNGDVAAHSSPVHWGSVSTKFISPERSPDKKSKNVVYQTEEKSSSSVSPSYFRREEVKVTYEPQPERIYPPTTLREVETERKLIAPQHVSTGRLQKLIEDPYFAKGKSKEKLVTEDKTKPKTPGQGTVPLSERNVNLWSTLPENSPSNKQNLMRWRNSMNLAENEELRQLMEEDKKRNESYDTSQLNEAEAKLESKLTQDKHRRSQEELDEEIRKIRRNKYKAKIDKAKKDYLASKASISDLYKDPDEFEKKFKVSIENVRLPEAPRGPFLEYLGKSGSLHTIKVADIKPFYYKPDSLYDNEYESIVRQAEKLWAPYRKRENAQKDNLYSHGRSTGYLETNFDAGELGLKPVYNGGVYETDLDEVIKENEAYLQQQQKEHESRSRTKSMTEVKKKSRGEIVPAKSQLESHVRARSADYLADRKAREEIEPPENQLKKILGDKDETELSGHELRFRKSTEKLPVPGWYLNSDFGPSAKADTSGKSSPNLLDRTATSDPSSPEMVSKLPHERTQSSQSQTQYLKRGQSTGTTTDYRAKSVPSQKPTEHTRYVSPWTYSGKAPTDSGSDKPSHESLPKYEPPKQPTSTPIRLTLQNGVAQKSRSTSEPKEYSTYEQKVITSYRSTTPHGTTTSQSQYEKKTMSKISTAKPKERAEDLFLPKDFFAKYKDEIEELRKSRSTLNGKSNNESNTTITYRSTDDEMHGLKKSSSQTVTSNQAYSVPVATVRPSNHLKEKQDNYSLTSTDLSSAGTPPPQAYQRPTYQRRSPPKPVVEHTIKHIDSGLIPFPFIDATPPRFNNEYSDNDVMTSTPYSSDNQSRKPYEYEEDRSRYLAPPPMHQPRNTPGWTVSAVPPDWNIPGLRESVVIEVSDQFFDSALEYSNKKNRKPGIPLTLEEALDSLLNLPTKGQRRLSTLDESSASLDTPVFPRAQLQSTHIGNLGIYTHNSALMEECKMSPEEAEDLLKHETLWVRCAHCQRVRQLSEARYRFVSCHHCYTYYCGRSCRKSDWSYHKEQCNYARINTLCKDIILKVRQDPDAQWQMSRVARQSYATRGRGSVNFRFRSPFLANKYVKGGWAGLNLYPGNYLNYYTVSELIDANKEANLINLCRRYDPQLKFVLSVSIMAEIEEVPETPPPEREKALADAKQRELSSNDDYESSQREEQPQRFERSRSVPSSKRKSSSSSGDDAKFLLKSVLRSMENIAPGPVYISSAERTANSVLPLTATPKQSFDRGYQSRHTVANSKGLKPVHYNSSPMVWSGPSLMAGSEDADETEV